MRTRNKLLFAAGIAGIAAAVVLGVANRDKPKAASPVAADMAAEVLPVETLELRSRDSFEISEKFVGRVVASRRSDLGFERAGTVTRVEVDEGDRVRKGAVLARLDTAILEARRRELSAQMAQAAATSQEITARLDLARATVKRRDDLIRNAHVSQQSYDEAMFDERALAAKLRANEATVAAVRAEVDVLDVELARSRLLAPFNGTIISRNADEGTAIDAGVPLLTMIEDDALEVRVGVSGPAAEALEPGKVYDIGIDGRAQPAVLRAVLPNIDPETRTIQAVFLLAEGGGAKPRSGQLAVFETRRRIDDRGFWLPMTALTSGRRGLWSTYAVVADPRGGGLRVERRDVQIIHNETDRVFVRGTLRDGERVVASGMHRLVPGQAVKLP